MFVFILINLAEQLLKGVILIIKRAAGVPLRVRTSQYSNSLSRVKQSGTRIPSTFDTIPRYASHGKPDNHSQETWAKNDLRVRR